MSELTKQGYDMIIDRIINRKVDLPEYLQTADELNVWCSAYAQCQHDILDLINTLKDQFGR